MVLKHFTARDVVSRCDVLQVGTQATSASAARFLDAIVARMPFPVRAIQVDGGSEFQGAFEEACRERGVLLLEYLARRRLKEASYPSLSQYAPNGRNPLPSLND